MAISQPIQHCKRVTLTEEADITLDVYSEAFIVKNYSGSDIYVTFGDAVDEETAIRIMPLAGQVCFINAKEGETNPKSNKVRVKGTGEVEVQAIQWQ